MTDTSINPDTARSVGSGRRKFHFRTDPDEVHGIAPTGRLMHIRVQEGDSIQEGDEETKVRGGSRAGGAPALTQWTVTEITSETVTGRETENGESQRWRRNQIEVALAVGRLSTNLTGFETITTIETNGDRVQSMDDPTVKVILYGDNSTQYYRTYTGTVGSVRSDIELWSEDPSTERLNDDMAEKLDKNARDTLAAKGYTVK